jgi:2-aminoadipate transaminase
MVIDDDPYGMLRFAGEPLPTLRALGGGDPLVFSVRTFSEIVAPGLRVGWVDTVPELQPLLTGFLAGGHLDEHLVTQRAEYRRRKEAMHASLREHFGDIARWTDPEGGFFCWVTLANGVHATELFEPALAEGVAFIPGSAFSPSGRFTDALRLYFASTPPDRIHEGLARLRRAVDVLATG